MDTVCGLEFKVVRDYVKSLRMNCFGIRIHLSKAREIHSLNSKVSSINFEVINRELVAKGYLEIVGDFIELTELGAKLSKTKLYKKMSQEKAQEKLSSLIQRVVFVNSNEFLFFYYIKRVYVFGSLLDGGECNDIDIILDVRRVFDDYDEQQNWESHALGFLNKKLTFFKELVFFEDKVVKFIKKGDARIDIQPLSFLEELISLESYFEVVFDLKDKKNILKNISQEEWEGAFLPSFMKHYRVGS